MKAKTFASGLLGTAFIFVALATASPAVANDPVALEVQVDVPPTWGVFLADDIAEAMTARVRETFRSHDYTGRIASVSAADHRTDATPRLNLRLLDWHVGRTGHVDCTFSAGLTTADGKAHALGLFTATEFTWGTRNRWQLSHAFERSAESALDRLWQKLEREGLTNALQAPPLSPTAVPMS